MHSTPARLASVRRLGRRLARSFWMRASLLTHSEPVDFCLFEFAVGRVVVFDCPAHSPRDGGAFATPKLLAAIDAIARDMPRFHFGRFDVRFDDLRALAQGRGFSIMEINGAGSEAIQAWDPDIGLVKGLCMVFEKQRILFAIGHAMRRQGVQPMGLLALARLNRRQIRLIDRYPPSN